jgi:hypothetical protein
MIIHVYPKLRIMKQTAEEMQQALGIRIGVTCVAIILEFFSRLFLVLYPSKIKVIIAIFMPILNWPQK